MKVKLLKIISFLIFLAGLSAVGEAQSSVNAAGGDAFGTGGTAAYSVGQVSYFTIGGNGLTIAQGVQQPFRPAVAIPTMSEWASMILMLLSMIVGVLILRTQERTDKIRQKTSNLFKGLSNEYSKDKM